MPQHILIRNLLYIDASAVFCPVAPLTGWPHIQTTYPVNDPDADTVDALLYMLATPGGGSPSSAYLIAQGGD